MIHVVLYEPEIPQNTGNIIRSCAAFHAKLHLIEPLGFYLDEAHLRRAGMDYRDLVNVEVHSSWEEFVSGHPGEYYFTTRYGDKVPDSFSYSMEQEIYFVFGKESTGIPKEILRANRERCIRIPMAEDARCLNVSNTVAIVLYEAVRQMNYEGLSAFEQLKPGVL
ncbi:MAG: tRNA (uridine(34)/cytosine(34)/5-carboxymethylaminomethyluridine(34)-2'-O)-methyltransferase TrmL [Solobacterium sp.]|nr:tRNA (uridine(34)/cytosine(34)/5-carboxymethylaminomethyluridine(34)-2'-O)-methyltransferase TrmL [Solobacterium sp.]